LSCPLKAVTVLMEEKTSSATPPALAYAWDSSADKLRTHWKSHSSLQLIKKYHKSNSIVKLDWTLRNPEWLHIVLELFLHLLAQSGQKKCDIKKIPKIFTNYFRSFTNPKKFSISLISYAKSQCWNFFLLQNHCEIWKSQDKRTRVIGKIYLKSMDFIDIVLLTRLCKKWKYISRTLRSILCTINIQFFSTWNYSFPVCQHIFSQRATALQLGMTLKYSSKSWKSWIKQKQSIGSYNVYYKWKSDES
jgi:hypothetical protein